MQRIIHIYLFRFADNMLTLGILLLNLSFHCCLKEVYCYWVFFHTGRVYRLIILIYNMNIRKYDVKYNYFQFSFIFKLNYIQKHLFERKKYIFQFIFLYSKYHGVYILTLKKKIFMHKVHSMPQIYNLRVIDITSEEVKFHISIFKNYKDKTQFLRFFLVYHYELDQVTHKHMIKVL